MNSFQSLPRTEAEAKSKGWTKTSDCSSNNGRGSRYILNNDQSVILVFGSGGVIAGIGAGIPKGAPFNFPSQNIRKLFVDEGAYLSITAFFVDPAAVCSSQSPSSPSSDRLVFKAGDFSLSVALTETDIDKKFWTRGKCFLTMGQI